MTKLNGTLTGENLTAAHDQKRREWIGIAMSYTLAIACLVWVFHDYDFSDLIRRMATVNPLLVAMAIICDVLSFVCQGLRWRLLLRPFGSISVFRTTQAIYSGLFINEVLPMKLGELLRAYLISRWTSVKLGSVLTSILIERLFDGFWLVVAFVTLVMFVPLPRKLMEAGDAFSALVFILITILIALRFGKTSLQAFAAGGQVTDDRNKPMEKAERSPIKLRLARSLVARLDLGAVALRAILHSPSSLSAFALSLLLISLQWLAFWLVMLAFGLHLSAPAAAAVFVIVHVGTLLPAAPANVGTYQIVTVLGLTLFGVEKSAAAGFSLVVFVLLSVHTWLLGFWALRRSGLTLIGMRTELSKSLPILKKDV